MVFVKSDLKWKTTIELFNHIYYIQILFVCVCIFIYIYIIYIYIYIYIYTYIIYIYIYYIYVYTCIYIYIYKVTSLFNIPKRFLKYNDICKPLLLLSKNHSRISFLII